MSPRVRSYLPSEVRSQRAATGAGAELWSRPGWSESAEKVLSWPLSLRWPPKRPQASPAAPGQPTPGCTPASSSRTATAQPGFRNHCEGHSEPDRVRHCSVNVCFASLPAAGLIPPTAWPALLPPDSIHWSRRAQSDFQATWGTWGVRSDPTGLSDAPAQCPGCCLHPAPNRQLPTPEGACPPGPLGADV